MSAFRRTVTILFAAVLVASESVPSTAATTGGAWASHLRGLNNFQVVAQIPSPQCGLAEADVLGSVKAALIGGRVRLAPANQSRPLIYVNVSFSSDCTSAAYVSLEITTRVRRLETNETINATVWTDEFLISGEDIKPGVFGALKNAAQHFVSDWSAANPY